MDAELVTLTDDDRQTGRLRTSDGPQDQSQCVWAQPKSWRDVPPTEKLRDQQLTREVPQKKTTEDEEQQRIFAMISQISVSDNSFQLTSFTGAANNPDKADEWLEQFEKYTQFRGIDGEKKLQLFQLLMKEQALIWLRSLPAATKNNLNLLMEEFKLRNAPSIVDKWQRTRDIWSRQQSANESVNDYIAFMQAAAQKAGMDENALVHPIIRGLKPDIRLFVLHNGAQTVQDILRAARISEAAHSADTNNSDQMSEMAANIKQLLVKMATQESKPVAEPTTTVRSVTFAQSAIGEEKKPSRDYRTYSPTTRSTSPGDGDRRPDRSSSRSPQRYSPGEYASRSTYDDRPPTQPQPTGTFRAYRGMSSPRPPYNSTYRNQSSYGDDRQRLSGNDCHFCGRAHQLGRAFCPAANLSCYKCRKIGHMARCCQSRPAMPQYSGASTVYNRQFYSH
jgi:hypothetical protein